METPGEELLSRLDSGVKAASSVGLAIGECGSGNRERAHPLDATAPASAGALRHVVEEMHLWLSMGRHEAGNHSRGGRVALSRLLPTAAEGWGDPSWEQAGFTHIVDTSFRRL